MKPFGITHRYRTPHPRRKRREHADAAAPEGSPLAGDSMLAVIILLCVTWNSG